MAFVKTITVESVVSSVQPLKAVNGSQVLNFSIPLSIPAKSPDGSQYINSDTLWIDCALWGKNAAAIAPHLQKGDLVRVTGNLRGNAYNSQDGEKVSINMTVDGFCFVDRAPSNNTAGQNGYNNAGGYNTQSAPAPAASYNAPATNWDSDATPNNDWSAEPAAGAWDPNSFKL